MLLTEILVTGYAFVIGACVGSFLNVVAWRLPLGMSLIKPASHCPQCKTPIRFRDNVPVLGWILLRGRCRSCGCWISPRYPLVEFAVGAAFALLAWYELATGGSNLPPQTHLWKPIATGLPFDSVLLSVWVYHVTLISLLVIIVLIEFDGKRLTRGFYIFAVGAGIAPPLAWTVLRVASTWTTDTSARGTLLAGMIGAVLGTCLAWSFDPRRSERHRVLLFATALGVVGLFLGEPGVCFTAIMAAVALVVFRLVNYTDFVGRGTPRSLAVLLGSLIAICYWPDVYGVELPIAPVICFLQTLIVFGICVILVATATFELHSTSTPNQATE